MQQVPLARSSSNGFGRRRGGDRDMGTRLESKLQSGKPNPARVPSAVVGGKLGGCESPPRDRLVYLATCLIGHPVEVHVRSGSIFTGIFHATDSEKDFGIILKMARLIKDGTLRGEKAIAEFVSRAPLKTLIIPAKDLVQVIAKDVAVTREGFASELRREKQQEIMTDSVISQSRHVEVGRELERWVPDEDDPQNPELENIFDCPRNRNWDQFETNKLLFGIESTFNEELYTTKLEKGPQMREKEREAMRIAKEIEGEDTKDLHLAEERGLHLHDNLDIDEETRFSSVYRGRRVDDSGYDADEEILLDSRNIETFGGSSASVSNRPTDFPGLKGTERVVVPSSPSIMDEAPSLQSTGDVDINHSGSNDLGRQLASELPFRSNSESESRIQDNLLDDCGGSSDPKDSVEKQSSTEDSNLSISMDSESLLIDKTDSCNKGGLSANATTSVLHVSSKGGEKQSLSEVSQGPASSKVPGELPVNFHGRPGSSTSSNSDRVGATSASSGPGLSPSSSVGSLSSEKSTLNPYAKEFKLNPNAKSFTPSHPTVRSPSPLVVSDGSFYYSPNLSSVTPMQGMPVGYGIGTSFGAHPPVIFNPAMAPMQAPQPYYNPNVPQQMVLAQPRQLMYVQNYRPVSTLTLYLVCLFVHFLPILLGDY
ncbi:hypothetical protein SLEP1_g13452 [Rubroshorea leprosula]|uniref:Sm domain-containing protein n=1 Tax=Rubroshorea leprosula TaxID=152421 RepID=A0AAV5IFY9_9ROSI|nr:hypothetical protein SLEP1_g13452 [Rubroshorea leprosula]